MTQAWDASNATWNYYDGTNSWSGGAGAIGERGVQVGVTGEDSEKKSNITFNSAWTQAGPRVDRWRYSQ